MSSGKDEIKYIAHIREEDKEEQDLKVHLQNVADQAYNFACIFDGEELAYVCGLLHDNVFKIHQN